MAFHTRIRQQPTAGGLNGTIHILENDVGDRAEVWPALGFNCFQWQTVRAGQSLDLLFADPQLFDNGRPTRSGFPILFPFPNRIRDGRFRWDGREYALPTNDSTRKNAIHGFACRRPWRVVGEGANAENGWITGEFHLSQDDPDSVLHWPCDFILRITYRLQPDRLRVEAEVTNPGRTDLPFGLGYHPYFTIPFLPTAPAEECTVQVPARSYWVLDQSLPTDATRPVDPARDFRRPRPFAGVNVDDVLTDLEPGGPPAPSGLRWNGSLRQGERALHVFSSPCFRELVVFTPPHRQAFCLEPYTCPTDAVNLQAHGKSVGWLTLGPGGRWTSVVEMACE